MAKTQNCQTCNSNRVISVMGHCNDRFVAEFGKEQYEGYVPRDLGIGGGDEIEMKYCLNCGQIQGSFPLLPTYLETNG